MKTKIVCMACDKIYDNEEIKKLKNLTAITKMCKCGHILRLKKEEKNNCMACGNKTTSYIEVKKVKRFLCIKCYDEIYKNINDVSCDVLNNDIGRW